ncbi:MAG: STAS domain-containing protein [Acidiferrobacterales bacterium]|nr:STAS domain-containing protein [Acidiferrobacterales bacterium]
MSESQTQKITGNLTFETTPGLLEQSKGWFTDNASQIVVDLSDGGRTDSAGIALLLQWIETARKQNLQLKFTNLPSQMREFIEANDLTRLFQQYTV